MANSERYDEMVKNLKEEHQNAPQDLVDRYMIYLNCAESNQHPGIDITNGHPLKTFSDWVGTR